MSDKKHKGRKYQDPLNGRKISDILTELPSAFKQENVTIADIRDALSGRIYGIFILFLAFPNLIPLPAPGLSAILGLPLVLLTTQLVAGFETPWFPKFIARRKVRLSQITKICVYVVPYVKKMENYVMPRQMWLLKYPANRVLAAICFFLSLIILLPIPFGNAIPALAVCLLAIAILQRDGLFVILGLFFAAVSAAVVAFSFGAVIVLVQKIF